MVTSIDGFYIFIFNKVQKAKQGLQLKPRRLGEDFALKLLREANRPLPPPLMLRKHFQKVPELRRNALKMDNYIESLRKIKTMEPFFYAEETSCMDGIIKEMKKKQMVSASREEISEESKKYFLSDFKYLEADGESKIENLTEEASENGDIKSNYSISASTTISMASTDSCLNDTSDAILEELSIPLDDLIPFVGEGEDSYGNTGIIPPKELIQNDFNEGESLYKWVCQRLKILPDYESKRYQVYLDRVHCRRCLVLGGANVFIELLTPTVDIHNKLSLRATECGSCYRFCLDFYLDELSMILPRELLDSCPWPIGGIPMVASWLNKNLKKMVLLFKNSVGITLVFKKPYLEEQERIAQKKKEHEHNINTILDSEKKEAEQHIREWKRIKSRRQPDKYFSKD